ncbi:hypothetical protein [Legionella shakespearei]|uniref:Uncharacterized protein n=1 Tax=Legionella shakespearei DSM 23087 TaxID=1122169 RepID=A0A0W0YSZ3_9GAMM|nr:hypothetical protein [Legionella shakespearei]KTD60027.1 hypothetical protein Lsha_1777 [Legionella shakespearei DSM 23087]
MSLTPLLQKHVLLTIINEGLYLAQKFGFEKGVDDLITLKDKVSKLPHDETILKKIIEDQKDIVFTGLAVVFGNDDYAKHLRHLFDSDDKEIKKILKKDAKEIQKALTQHTQNEVNNFIKDKLKVSKKYITEAQDIFKKNMEFFVVNFAEIAKLLAMNDSPQNFNLYGVQINSLYKLIKILNGINTKQLALQFLPYFEQETFNPLIVKAFFNAEKTDGFCRHSTLLILIGELLTEKHPSFTTIVSDFIKALPASSTKSGALLVKNDALTREAFIALVDDILKLVGNFELCLKSAAQVLENREEVIRALHTTQDIFLKTFFYFGCVSPILKKIEQNLPDNWPQQTSKMLRLELSFALDIVVGLQTPRSLEKIKTSGVLCPALLELCTSTELQVKSEQSFEPFIQNVELERPAESSSSHQSQPDPDEKPGKITPKEQETDAEKLSFSMHDLYSRKRIVRFYSGADSDAKKVSHQKITSTPRQRKNVQVLFNKNEATASSAPVAEESDSLTPQ